MLTADTEMKPVRETATPQAGKPTFIGDAALHLADMREGRSRLRARDLVSLLLCHGARAWRSSQPQTRVRIKVCSPLGGTALNMRIGGIAAN